MVLAQGLVPTGTPRVPVGIGSVTCSRTLFVPPARASFCCNVVLALPSPGGRRAVISGI